MTLAEKLAAEKLAATKLAAEQAATKLAADKAAALLENPTETYTKEQYDAIVAKMTEFRTTNIAMVKENADLKTKYDDVDLEDYAKMIKAQKEAKEVAMIKAGQVDALVASKVKEVQTKHALEVEKTTKVNANLNRQLEVLIIDNAVRAASVTEGVVDTGIDDMVLRSKSVFKVVDGIAIAYDKADVELYNEGTVEKMSVTNWVKSQSETAPHLFKASTGSNAKTVNGVNIIGKTKKEIDAMSGLQKITQGLEDRKNATA